MVNRRYQSWGRIPRVTQESLKLNWRSDSLPTDIVTESTFLPFGNGRSYGDVCLNEGGFVLDCRSLDHFIDFNPDTGILRCEAGVLFSEILYQTVAKGWFLPVTPGTQFVTVGGAIANDVHGKNHHRAGTFGQHIRCFELMRSDGSRHICSREKNSELYRATIGGLGLTGAITWAEIQLHPINNAYINQEVIRYSNLSEFFSLARESDQAYEHTVAWIDCLAKGKQLGRGLFIRGNYSQPFEVKEEKRAAKVIPFPIDPPFNLINRFFLKLFNTFYYHKQLKRRSTNLIHYAPFFYPLDTIYAWNRIYGKNGFFQYQCAIPSDHMEDGIREILELTSNAGHGSFLTVLKLFGDKPSPGLLSFPMPGATLALDFPNHGKRTLRLLDQLDEITRLVGGRVYPSKDSRMSGEDFRRNYPNWPKMAEYIDPNISSSFWRRVMATL